jgi:hypothetical protein
MHAVRQAGAQARRHTRMHPHRQAGKQWEEGKYHAGALEALALLRLACLAGAGGRIGLSGSGGDTAGARVQGVAPAATSTQGIMLA